MERVNTQQSNDVFKLQFWPKLQIEVEKLPKMKILHFTQKNTFPRLTT